MDAKIFTDQVLGPCHLDRYDSCGKHQSLFNYGVHCDKWQDYYYAVAATIDAYKEELNIVIKDLIDGIGMEPPSPLWMSERATKESAYNKVLGAVERGLTPPLPYGRV